MSDMQHINLVEYSPDRNVCLCSLRYLSIFSSDYCLYLFSLSRVSNYCLCYLIRLFSTAVVSRPRLSLFSVTSLSFPFRVCYLFLCSPYSIDYVWLCSLQRLSRFSIPSVIVLYRVCLCVLDLFCLFFLVASWKLKCAWIVLTVILQFFDCDIYCWVNYL